MWCWRWANRITLSPSAVCLAWKGSIQAPTASQPQTENIEVIASHIGIGVNPSAMWALADRLAQPEGQWQPFRRPRLLGAQHLVFPDPLR